MHIIAASLNIVTVSLNFFQAPTLNVIKFNTEFNLQQVKLLSQLVDKTVCIINAEIFCVADTLL